MFLQAGVSGGLGRSCQREPLPDPSVSSADLSLSAVGRASRQGPVCVAVLAFSKHLCCGPAMCPGVLQAARCPEHRAEQWLEQWTPGGTPQGLPWAFPRLTPGRYRAWRVTCPGCDRAHTRARAKEAVRRRPHLWPLGDPNTDAARPGPPRSGELALRFLLSWAAVDEGRLEGGMEGAAGHLQP